MSYPFHYHPAMTFGPPSSAQTGDVTWDETRTDKIYKTTSGATFRCSPSLEIEKFLCCQCSGDREHVAEAEPFYPNPGSSGSRGILDVTPKGVKGRFIADATCMIRDDPRGAGFYLQDSQLTKIAQQNEVVCAHVEDGHECGRSILLSELPRHHYNAHRARPLPVHKPPITLFFGQTRPNEAAFGQTRPSEAAATNNLYPSIAGCRKGAAASVSFGSKGGVGVFGTVNALPPASPGALSPKEQTPLFGPPKITMTELTKRIEDIEKGIEGNKKSAEDSKKGVEDSKKEIEDLNKTVVDLKQQFAAVLEQNKHLQKILAQCLPSAQERQFSPHNTGIIRWKLANFKDTIMSARCGINTFFWSDSFYTNRGYKVSALIYPNGDGNEAVNKAVSLYLGIMQTDNDEFLFWPFNHAKVTFSVIGSEGQELMRHQFKTDPDSSSFLRPTRSHNTPTGKPIFIEHEGLDNLMAGADLLLKITVDPQPLERSGATGGQLK